MRIPPSRFETKSTRFDVLALAAGAIAVAPGLLIPGELPTLANGLIGGCDPAQPASTATAAQPISPRRLKSRLFIYLAPSLPSTDQRLGTFGRPAFNSTATRLSPSKSSQLGPM